MEFKKIFLELGKYVVSGAGFKDHPFYLLSCLIILSLMHYIFRYIMRNQKVTDNDEFIDENGNPRRNNSTYRK